jgi:molecular chaperone HtpG
MKLPQTERVREQGYDILCMTDDVDEFAVDARNVYGKAVSVRFGRGLDLVSEEEKKASEEANKTHHDLLSALKTALGDKVKDVRLSEKLKSSPVCLTSDGPLSIEMEKVLAAMPVSDGRSRPNACWKSILRIPCSAHSPGSPRTIRG